MASIELHIGDGIAEIVLNRPSRKNALRNEDWLAMRDTVAALPDAARCVLMRGEGGAFCAGWDLDQWSEGPVDARHVVGDIVNPALRAIRDIPVPTIAAVEGACVGGGLGIAMACDIVLAAEDATLGSPFRNIGILPDSGAHHFLRERLRHHRASQLIYTGRLFDGAEAHRLGLVCEACPPERLVAEARALAATIASGPTAAFAESKRILLADAGYAETLDLEAEGQGRVFATADAAEGLDAFLAKRKPQFQGR